MAITLGVTGLHAWQGFKPYEYTFGYYGFGGDASGHRIIKVTGAEALAKGFQSGDTILAIDGVPIDNIGDSWLAVRQALLKAEGDAVAFTVRNVEGQVQTTRLTRSTENVRKPELVRKVTVVFGLLGSVVFIWAAILLFRRRRELVPAILAASFILILAGPDASATIWIAEGNIIGFLQGLSIVGLATFLFGILIFPDGQMSRVAWMLAISIFVWLVLMLILPAEVTALAAPITYVPLLAAAIIRQLLRYRGLNEGVARQQVRWGIFGFATGAFFLVIAILLDAIVARISGTSVFTLSIASAAFENIALICIAGGIVVSLMRYRLYDADTVIGRSAAYGFLTLAFLALFAGSQKVIEALGETYLGDDVGALAGAIGAAIAAVLMVPLHRRANDWAEQQFQRDLLGLRRGLPRLVSDLRETATPERIAQTVAERTTAGVKARHAAVIIDRCPAGVAGIPSDLVVDWLAKSILEPGPKVNEIDPLFPHRFELACEAIGRVGWLLVGPHPDGNRLGKDEREVLNEIAEPVAQALAIASTRASEKHEFRSALKSIVERLRNLEQFNSLDARAAPHFD